MRMRRRRPATVLIVLSLSAICSLGTAAAAPTPGAAENADGAGAEPTAAATGEAAEKPTPDPAMAQACKQAVAKLAKGDTKALSATSSGGGRSLAENGASEPAVTCLAVAIGNVRICDALADPAKKACAAHAQDVADLKGLPKEAIKAQVIYGLCMSGEPKQEKAVCEKARDAVKSGKAEGCAAFSKPSDRDLCAGIATGDASKCSALADADQRDFCAALATDDAKRCPQGSDHCRTMISTIVALRKGDAKEVEPLDPILAAAKGGKQACAPLLAKLEKDCSGQP